LKASFYSVEVGEGKGKGREPKKEKEGAVLSHPPENSGTSLPLRGKKEKGGKRI